MIEVKDWYEGQWIQTYSGKQFYPLRPDASLICIKDIAHALAMQCRYNGHSREFYSVAQHSVLVSNNVSRHYALWALLHDAGEAYLGDLVRPIKQNPKVRELWKPIEHALDREIEKAFGFSVNALDAVDIKHADRRACVTEKRDVLPQAFKSEDDGLEPFRETIIPWNPYRAESEFLFLFEELTRGRAA